MAEATRQRVGFAGDMLFSEHNLPDRSAGRQREPRAVAGVLPGLASPAVEIIRRGNPVLLGVLLADVTCFGIVMPLLASYAAGHRASSVAIGALVATYSLMHLALAPWWGRLSDRVGRRPVLLIGIAGTLVSSVVFAVADSFFTILLSRVIAGVCGASLNVAQAFVADETEPEGRTGSMGVVGATFGLGFILGPAIGGITSRWGPAAPGLAAAAIAALNLVVAMAILGEPHRHRPATETTGRSLPWRTLASPLAAAFCSTLAFTVLYVTFPLHAERVLGYGRSRVSWLFAFVGLITALVQGGLARRLARQTGEGGMILAGGLLMGVGLAFLAGAAPEGTGGLLAGLTALGAGFGLVVPAEAGYLSRVAGAQDQGRALGVLQSTNAMARIAGPVVAGAVMGLGGAVMAFLVATGAAVLAAGLGGVMATSAPRKSGPTERP
jgi:MFS family permease